MVSFVFIKYFSMLHQPIATGTMFYKLPNVLKKHISINNYIMKCMLCCIHINPTFHKVGNKILLS